MTETNFSVRSSEEAFAEALAQIPQSVYLLSEYKFTLAQRLQEAMETKGLLQSQLANLAQKAESVISHILAADKNVTLRTIAELSVALGIDLLRICSFSTQRWVTEAKSTTADSLNFSVGPDGRIVGIGELGVNRG